MVLPLRVFTEICICRDKNHMVSYHKEIGTENIETGFSIYNLKGVGVSTRNKFSSTSKNSYISF